MQFYIDWEVIFMIKALNENDINIIMKIWLDLSMKSHKFIPEDYWLRNYQKIKKEIIPESEVFVYDDKDIIKGFIILSKDNWIKAFCVDEKY